MEKSAHFAMWDLETVIPLSPSSFFLLFFYMSPWHWLQCILKQQRLHPIQVLCAAIRFIIKWQKLSGRCSKGQRCVSIHDKWVPGEEMGKGMSSQNGALGLKCWKPQIWCFILNHKTKKLVAKYGPIQIYPYCTLWIFFCPVWGNS